METLTNLTFPFLGTVMLMVNTVPEEDVTSASDTLVVFLAPEHFAEDFLVSTLVPV